MNMNQDDSTPECVQHMQDFDEDCEFCKTELDFILRRTAKVVKGNEAALQRIAYLGHTVDTSSVAMMRLNTLIDFILSHNPKMKAKFESFFAANCGESLRLTEETVNRQRLMAP